MQTSINQDKAQNNSRSSGRNHNSKSPLRYPGGKTRAVNSILPYFPDKPGILVSPFFGGGSVELAAAKMGWKVLGYDRYQPLVDFWQTVLTDPAILADAVMDYYPLSRAEFYRLQQQESLTTQLTEATRYFVLNRCSFSGTTMSGGMSPGHDRFTVSAIERLRTFHVGKLWVEQADFTKSIALNRDAFLYLDPPYYTPSRLYGRRGDLHDGFYHQGLCKLLRNRDRWVLSYDDCLEVREMYSGYKIVELNWKYGMSSDKKSREILILSREAL